MPASSAPEPFPKQQALRADYTLESLWAVSGLTAVTALALVLHRLKTTDPFHAFDALAVTALIAVLLNLFAGSMLARRRRDHIEMLAVLPSCVAILDANNRVRSVSESLERNFGWKPAHLLGQPFIAYIHPDDLSVVQKSLEAFRLQPLSALIRLNFRFQLPDKSYAILNCAVRHARETGRLGELSLGFRDNTHGFLMDQALHSNRLLRDKLIDALPLGIAVVDPETKTIDFANAYLAAMYGDAAHSLQGVPLNTVFRAVSSDHYSRNHRFDTIAALKGVSGTETYVSTTSVEEMVDTKAKRFVFTLDVDEWMRTRDELGDVLERLRLATKAACVGVWQYIPATGELRWDEQMLSLRGISPKDFRGMETHWRTIHPEDLELSKNAIETAVREESEFNIYYRVVHPDGSIRHIQSQARAIRDADGVLSLLGTNWDVTSSKIHEEEMRRARDAARLLAEEAQKSDLAKSEFLANMSHEIRTPLNGIVGMTDLALETELTAEQQEYLDTVKLSADALLTVINDILDFSKIEAGKIDLEVSDFDLRDALESALKTVAVRADEKGLELLCDVAPEVPDQVRGDSARLRQVLLNLVGNAIKFTERGEVAVRARVEASEGNEYLLGFTVADTGIGVPPEKQKLIFEPFSQADATTTRKYGGTGLGLTISTRLVEMMGGKIWVESEMGQGAQFHFTLRLGAAETKVIPAVNVSPDILRGIKVLVVDDNRTNRRILTGMLERWGAHAVSVEGGEEALGELSLAREARQPYELVLTDMHMPVMDGFTLIQRIQENPSLSAPTIIMLSSTCRTGDVQRSLELGAAAYLMKPIRQAELREAIGKALAAKEQGKTTRTIAPRPPEEAREPAVVLQVLLAEDNAVNQRLAVRLLERRGHHVVLAGNGREALEAIEKERFDLVLMDVQMPEMDGFEATAALRQKERSSGMHLPVIALTAHAMKGDRERCLAAGMDGYLAKPIHPEELDLLLHKFAPRRENPRPARALDPESVT